MLRFTYKDKIYYVYGSTKAEVEEKKYKKRQELESGSLYRKNPVLRDFYSEWMDYRRGKVSESTICTQNHHFQRCAAINISGTLFGDLRITEITSRDIKKVQMELENSGLNSNSVNQIIDHLSNVFNTAVKEDLITKNPCIAVDRIRRTEPLARDTNHRALTLEETQAFFQEAKTSYYNNLFCMLLQTGMRIGEIATITWSDIDYVNGCIHISRTLTRTESGQDIIGNTTKTAKGTRDIPMSAAVKSILKAQKELNSEVFGNVVNMQQKPVFRSPEGTIIRNPSVNAEIRRICKRAGVEKFTSHAFRHTFATRFMEQRPQDFKILSEILGHSTVNITLNLYTHAMEDTKKAAMNELVIDM
ncbi:MAG: tyrosine-type recombinase/integrase [Lachnospiraceae bacterium]|nr:tyrosine-type recombinase/integrase [Lachnospiraceae bacterium]